MEITPARDRILEALLTSTSIREVAAKSGVAVRTVYNYLGQDDDFKKEYAVLRSANLKEASDRIAEGVTCAVDVLKEIAENSEVSPSARVSACRAILEHYCKMQEVVDVDDRLSEIEKRLT